MANLFKALEYTLPFEGGYSDIKNDHGGKTNYGITQATLTKFLKDYPSSGVTDNVKNISLNDAEEIYKWGYWRFDGVYSQSIATKLFDMSVNMGLYQAIKYCQRILGLIEDGLFGPKTCNGINSMDPSVLMDKLVDMCVAHYLGILRRDPTQEKFRKGWMRRAMSKPND